MVKVWNELEKAKKIDCENCGKKNVWGRRIESMDTLHRESRGWYDVCFECFTPRKRISTRHGKFMTPMSREQYERWKQKKEAEEE